MNAHKRRLLLVGGAAIILALALLGSGYSGIHAQGPTGIGQNQNFVTTNNGTVAVLTRFVSTQTTVSSFSNQVGSTTGTGANTANNQTNAANQSNTNQTAGAAGNTANNQMGSLQSLANQGLMKQAFSGNLIAQLDMDSSATATFDSRLLLNAACSSLVAFRLTQNLDLAAHPFSCNGDMLTLQGTGGSFPSTFFFATGSSSQNSANPGANTASSGTNQTALTQAGTKTNQPSMNQTGAANQSTGAVNQANANQVTSAMGNNLSIVSRNQINNALPVQGSVPFLANQSLRNQNFNGNLIGEVDINAADTITFDTQSQLGAACPGVMAFRKTGNGDLVQQQVTCNGNMLTLVGTGGNFTSSYFFATGQFK